MKPTPPRRDPLAGSREPSWWAVIWPTRRSLTGWLLRCEARVWRTGHLRGERRRVARGGECARATWRSSAGVRTLEANLDSVFVSTRAVLPLMRPGGRVVIVSSTAGQRGEAFHADYAATKGALISLTKSLAIEYAPALMVNCVAPGWVDTEMSAPRLLPPRTGERIRAHHSARPYRDRRGCRRPHSVPLQRSGAPYHRRGAERQWRECSVWVKRVSGAAGQADRGRREAPVACCRCPASRCPAVAAE